MSRRAKRWRPFAVAGALVLAGVVGLALGLGGASGDDAAPGTPGEVEGPLVAPAAGAAGGDPPRQPPAERERVLPRAAGAGVLAAGKRKVARRFGAAWINRPSSAAELQGYRAELVGLASGPWARELDVALEQAQRGGGAGGGGEGEVVAIEPLRRRSDSAELLVITRERLTLDGAAVEPFHYGLYLARLIRSADGYTVAAWEPQF